VRNAAGSNILFVTGYLLYQLSSGQDEMSQRYLVLATNSLMSLVEQDEAFVQAHPEVLYFLAKCETRQIHFSGASRHMLAYIEAIDARAAAQAAEPTTTEETTDQPAADGDSPDAATTAPITSDAATPTAEPEAGAVATPAAEPSPALPPAPRPLPLPRPAPIKAGRAPAPAQP
jgi:hypothetical protein